MGKRDENGDALFSVSQVPVLDPAGVRARLDDRGNLELTLPDGAIHRNARVVPAFPVSRPNRLLYLFDESGAEIGLLPEPKGLDHDSRDLLLNQADHAYFLPRIERILRVEERPGSGIAHWYVNTDRGLRDFDVVSRSESVWYIGKSRVVLRDAHNNRYLMEDVMALDARSRALADLYL